MNNENRNRIRIDKMLSNSGFGSRKDIKEILKNGRVKVDSQVVKDSGIHVDSDKNIIEVDGVRVIYKEFVYLMMNKPAGVISATWDARFQTVIDLVPHEYRHYDLFPVGRLDRDTEGLLIITNDGKLAHELLSPKKHVNKTYFAIVDGCVGEEDVKSFQEGVHLDDGYKTLPAKMDVIVSGETSQIMLTIVEGKFHQVKRMFEAVNKKVKYLKRVSMGGLKLDEALEEGKLRELYDEEVDLLKNDNLLVK